MLHGLTGWHLIILLVVILLLFGAAKLPALAKSVGQSARVLKGEMKAMKEEDAASAPPSGDSGEVRHSARDEKRMPLGGHLVELRRRLLIAAVLDRRQAERPATSGIELA
jgi:sec-independent protein translocase protein TatA